MWNAQVAQPLKSIEDQYDPFLPYLNRNGVVLTSPKNVGARFISNILQLTRIERGLHMRRRNKVILGILLVLAVVLVGFVVWAETPPAPMPEACDALKSDSSVTVSTGSWLVFSPVSSSASTGFIIYPGGRVDFRSYAPLAHAVAAEGYLVVIPKMPLNLAVFGADTANDVIKSFPQISSWAIGGHSLGGTMAAQFAYDNPSKIRGIVLLAAYPPSGVNLSTSNLSVTTIHGTNDGLLETASAYDHPSGNIWRQSRVLWLLRRPTRRLCSNNNQRTPAKSNCDSYRATVTQAVEHNKNWQTPIKTMSRFSTPELS
jgi:hypothetical protein